jgi:hypothetical protein
MKFSKEERETVLTYDDFTGEWDVYTSVPSHIRLFTSKIADISGELEVVTKDEGIPTSIRFNLPKESINPHNFIKKKRVVSEAQLKNLKKTNEKNLATV